MGITKKAGSAKEAVQSVKVKAKGKPSSATKDETKKGGGLDEIDSLFADKKKQQKDSAEQAKKQKEEAKQRRKASSQNSKPTPNTTAMNKGQWVDDGLGGKYNSEGYTGRVEDGVKVFKTHLLQSSASGSTAECPFDCNCCFI